MEKLRGKFYTWSSSDEEGEFSKIVEILSHEDGKVTFRDNEGHTLTVPETDGTFVSKRAPKNWEGDKVREEVKVETKTEDTTTVAKVRKARTKTKPNKVDKVTTLLGADILKISRKDAIDKIVAANISTANGASTFFNTARKAALQAKEQEEQNAPKVS